MGGICSTPIRGEEKLLTAPFFSSRWTYKGFTFENGSGDICFVEVDAIVNASNGQLVHNNGLSNSIIAQGGEIIQEESNKIIEDNNGALSVGTAVATSGGSLSAQYIIHVITPIWTGGDNNERFRLEKCIKNALFRADELGLKSIAFPSLTSGVFGFPREICAEIIINKTVEYLEEHASTTSLKNIKFINLDVSTVRIFKLQLEKFLSQKVLAEGGNPSKVLFTENENSINQNQDQRLFTLESQQTRTEKNEIGQTINTAPI